MVHHEQLELDDLACERRTNPLGIDTPSPRLSWTVRSARRGVMQSAYQVLVAGRTEDLEAERGSLWDSGKVLSGENVGIVYRGRPLDSGERVWWKVRVWDERGTCSGYSRPAYWEMGLLQPTDWTGVWIGLDDEEPDYIDPPNGDDLLGPNLQLQPSPFLRREFELAKPVVRARLYITAKGLYEAYLNGKRIGDAVLSPGWTDYDKRIQYQTYDVTDLLAPGGNVLGAVLGDGWYCGYVGFNQKRRGAHYGWHPRLLARLDVDFADGERLTVDSDRSWRSNTSPLMFSDLLLGEWYDARKELPGWNLPGFDDSGWLPVSVDDERRGRLTAEPAPPVKVTEERAAEAVTEPVPGTFVFDFGQNMVGWARLKAEGQAGTKVVLRFAEMVNPDGTVYTDNWRSARPVDTYVMSGKGREEFEPRFTFHGFRYVEVTGLAHRPALDALTGLVVGSALEPTGSFECSSEMVNQLQRNIVWTQRGNFLSVPTDCPQRDERLGWLGDAQIYARTACFNMDAANFFEKWMADIVDAQSPAGAFPDVAPRMAELRDGAPAWGDAGIIIPWTIYSQYGDKRVIEENYDAMTAWIAFVHGANPGLLRTHRLGRNYGDWLAIDTGTPKQVLATAYFAHIAALMSRMAEAVGREQDARRYRELFGGIRRAFNQAYVSSDGRIAGNSQTCYLLALHVDLLPEELCAAAAEHLVNDIRERDWHLSTGFIGVGYLCPVLSKMGYDDVAYRLLLNDSYPSWGYSIKHGATTIWERWDGWTEEHGFQTPSMNSFNHYSLGSIGEWLYRYAAGIDLDPDSPGYRHFVIRPRPGGGLRYVKASYRSVRGLIRSEWEDEEDIFRLRITVPANTSATVHLPVSADYEVTEGSESVEQREGIRALRRDEEATVFTVGSGDYRFEATRAVATVRKAAG
jgi:alpha-L-rhamnosidase